MITCKESQESQRKMCSAKTTQFVILSLTRDFFLLLFVFFLLSVFSLLFVFPPSFLCFVSIVNRTFRPDFVLIRQHLKDMEHDYRPLILGLSYGGVNAVNSIHATYNFTDRPWVVSDISCLSSLSFQYYRLS